LGTGTGSFGTATNYGSYFDSLALGDFNSDGNLDIVALQSNGGEFPSYTNFLKSCYRYSCQNKFPSRQRSNDFFSQFF
jgi:hypothetical protein